MKGGKEGTGKGQSGHQQKTRCSPAARRRKMSRCRQRGAGGIGQLRSVACLARGLGLHEEGHHRPGPGGPNCEDALGADVVCRVHLRFECLRAAHLLPRPVRHGPETSRLLCLHHRAPVRPGSSARRDGPLPTSSLVGKHQGLVGRPRLLGDQGLEQGHLPALGGVVRRSHQ